MFSCPLMFYNCICHLLPCLQMVMEFGDTCVGCEQVGIKQKELERFVSKFRALSSDEIAVALMVTNKDIFNLLTQMVPCVGCRRR